MSPRKREIENTVRFDDYANSSQCEHIVSTGSDISFDSP